MPNLGVESSDVDQFLEIFIYFSFRIHIQSIYIYECMSRTNIQMPTQHFREVDVKKELKSNLSPLFHF